MDVKISNKILVPLPQTGRSEKSGKMRGKEAGERDANGQTGYSGQEERREKLSEEEFKEAVHQLESLSGIKDNNLVVRVVNLDQRRWVQIEELSGKIVRRIPEFDLVHLLSHAKDTADHKGKIYHKIT